MTYIQEFTNFSQNLPQRQITSEVEADQLYQHSASLSTALINEVFQYMQDILKTARDTLHGDNLRQKEQETISKYQDFANKVEILNLLNVALIQDKKRQLNQ